MPDLTYSQLKGQLLILQQISNPSPYIVEAISLIRKELAKLETEDQRFRLVDKATQEIELIKQKENETKSISDLLKDLEELFGEVDQAASLPQKMGFDDRGSFDIYMEIKNTRDENIDLEIAKDFAKKLAQRIKNKIYTGWQDNDAEVKRFEVDIKIFADFDEYESLNISDDKELVDRIIKRIIQHYSIE